MSCIEHDVVSFLHRPAAFVCQNFTCQAPTTEAGKVRELLQQKPGAGPAGGAASAAGASRLQEVDISSLLRG